MNHFSWFSLSFLVLDLSISQFWIQRLLIFCWVDSKIIAFLLVLITNSGLNSQRLDLYAKTSLRVPLSSTLVTVAFVSIRLYSLFLDYLLFLSKK